MPSDGTDPSVLQASRVKCWAARDAYFACADAAGSCWRLKRAYSAACPAAWVKHFDKGRADRERLAAVLAQQKGPQ